MTRDPFGMQRYCRGCGCTERHACGIRTERGTICCSWVVLDLDSPTGFCNACAMASDWSQVDIEALVAVDGPTRRPTQLVIA